MLQKLKKSFKTSIIILIITILLSPSISIAQEEETINFNPNLLITTTDFFDYLSLTVTDIQQFLEERGGSLANYKSLNYQGVYKTAAQIIHESAQKYQISPKVLIVMLQKEQSLITNPYPSEYNYIWAMGYARCDSCDPDDPQIAKYGGFGKQVDRAAWRLRYYTNNSNSFNFHAGEGRNVDGVLVTPENQATANLYNYTPHLHGNENFVKIWQRWFAKNYPDGSILQVEGEPGVWLIDYGKKRPFWSKTALVSRYDINSIIQVSKSDLNKYPTGRPIKFPQYSLLKAPNGAVFLLVNDTRRGITSGEVFRSIGFNWDEVIDVSWDEINNYTEGKPITMESVYPLGALVQNNQTGGIYYVEDAIKFPIISKEIMNENFPNRKIVAVTPEELDKYKTSLPVKFPNGTLITSEKHSSVFVISNGQRRPIGSKQAFDHLKYKWDNIIFTTPEAVNLHPLGAAVE